MYKLSDISTIKDILSRHGFSFSKSLGQNFLINPSVCPKMASEGGAKPGVGIIEVGPGIGVLTTELCKLADKVVSIEIDKRLIPVLGETMAEFDNFKLVNEDVLKVDLKKLIEEEFAGMEVCVCANLPYYITSPVIMKLLEDRLPIKSLTVMVQTEAADRICAKLATRDVGAISVAVSYYSEPEILFKVSRGSFMPAPNVDSAVIRLNVREKPSVNLDSEKNFFAMIKACFCQRRKTMLNSISSGTGITKDKIAQALTECDIPLNYRAEQMTLEQFANLSNSLYK